MQVFVERRRARAHPYNAGGGFMLVSKAGLRALRARLQSRDLGMQAVRVLMDILIATDYEGRVRTGQKELAAGLGMDQSAVSKAVRALIAADILMCPEHSRGYYRVNPQFAWQGSARTLKRALERHEAA